MLQALIYLRLASLGNRLAAAAARLRQPKYFAGAVVGAAYIYFFMLRPLVSPPWRAASGIGGRARYGQSLVFPIQSLSESWTSLAAAAVFSFFLLRQFLVWILPPAQPGLRFSEAEIAFLFPAPFTRRRLVHFNLFSSQIRIFVSSILLTVLFNRWGGVGWKGLGHAVGWWVILSAINLHSTGIGLAAARALSRTARPARVRAAAVAALVLLAACVATPIAAGNPSHERPASHAPEAWVATINQSLDSGLPHVILWPFRWIVSPFLATEPGTFFRGLGVAVLFLAGLYFWIVTMQVPFEEGSIALAERRAEWIASRTTGVRVMGKPVKPTVRRDPFRLPGPGRPEFAFLWKNLLAIQSWFDLRTAILLLAIATVMTGADFVGTRASGYAPVVFAASFSLGFFGLFMGPQLLRQDLRSDLPNADILKTYPLPGWQIVLGELLTPVAVLSGVLWLSIISGSWALGQLEGGLEVKGPERVIGILCLGLLVPPVCGLQLLIPNAAAVLFPGWFQSMRPRGGGIEMMGQRLIFVFGQLLAVAVAILPAALLAAGVFVSARWWIHWIAPERFATIAALLGAAATALAILAGELWCGVWWLGGRFERLDISRETGR